MRFLYVFLVAIAVIVASRELRSTPEAEAANTVRVFIELPGAFQTSDWAGVRTLGGEPRHLFAAANTISVDIPEWLLPLFERNSRFGDIRPVPSVSVVEDMLPWGVDQVDAERVWGTAENAVNVGAGRNSGAGVRVAVIDTGIASHAELNVVGGASFVASEPTYVDGHGHGTHVSGTIAARDNGTGALGVAPGVDLLAVKVLSSSGGGLMDDVAAGIDWSVANGAKVINMSLSCSGAGCDDVVMRQSLANAAASNVVIVAAAGNTGSGADTVGWPAKNAEVIAVAATTNTNARASFSSTGPKVEIAAPGSEIFSTYLNGSYATMSGTSMASPHVAGAAALLVACGQSAAQVRSTLTATADDLGASGRDNQFGYGLLDVDGAVTCGGSGGTSPTPTPTATPGPSNVTETFETNNWTGGSGWTGSWTRTGSSSYTSLINTAGPQAGSRHARLLQTGAISRPFSLAGFGSATLTFWAKGNSWESSDRASVQVSTNGTSWTTVLNLADGFDTNAYRQQQVNLNQWAGQPTVYVRFLGQMNQTNDYLYIDSITIARTTGSAVSQPTATPTNTPVGPTATPTRTNTPAPPTATPTRTPTPRPPTATPTRTPPSSCSWWQQLLGQC